MRDVGVMKDVLTQRFEFRYENVIILTDFEATRQGILDSLENLTARITACDTLIVYYSGGSVRGGSDPYLVVHDSVAASGDSAQSKSIQDGINAAELHRLMKRIPTSHKTLMLDTDPSQIFLDLAEQDADYRESVLPAAIGRENRLAVEAGTSLGWAAFADHVVSIDHFGASAPAKVLAEQFGFTVDALLERWGKR